MRSVPVVLLVAGALLLSADASAQDRRGQAAFGGAHGYRSGPGFAVPRAPRPGFTTPGFSGGFTTPGFNSAPAPGLESRGRLPGRFLHRRFGEPHAAVPRRERGHR